MAWVGEYKNLSEIKKYDSYAIEHNNAIVDYERLQNTGKSFETDLDKNLVTLLKKLDEDITLLELGCESSCRIYYILKKYFDSKLKKYYGIDLPDILKNSSHVKKHTNVFLTDDINQITEKISTFYCNSALQYLQNPYEFMTRVLTLSPKYVIFNRTPFISEETFLSLQQFNNREFPYTFFNDQEFLSFFAENNYELESMETHATYPDIPNGAAMRSTNLVFSKIASTC